MEALVIARTTSPAWDILHLLSRAGFSVDIVTTSRYLGLSRFARTVHTVTSDKALAPSAYDVVRIRTKPYDWVMATDDLTLRALAESERSCFAHGNRKQQLSLRAISCPFRKFHPLEI